MPVPAAPKEPDPSETRVAAVKQVLDTKLAQYGGTWSATYIDLESGRDVTVNDEKLVAASLVKLYIMLAVFDGIEHGTITDDANVNALLKQMITVSSNEAANGLLPRIGNGDDKAAIATVTAIAQRYGFTSSEELRTLTGMASGNAVENWTSTRDCGSFLSQVYAGTLVSKNASERMMQLLLGQAWREACDSAWDVGVRWSPVDTERGIAGRIAECLEAVTPEGESDFGAYLAELADHVTAGAFGGRPTSVAPSPEPLRGLCARRAVAAKRRGNAARRMFRWPFPASLRRKT